MEILQGSENKNPEEFYRSLKEKLENNHDFPEDYLFKFIIPTDEAKLTEIYKVFDGIKFTLGNRESKNGEYTACNINAFVLDADQVVRIYQEVATIENVILL
jgi:putative lipoic acid-binding regulatory protein